MIDLSSTLKDVCASYYFLRNPRIRCEKTRKQYRIAIDNLTDFLGHAATIADLSDDNVSGMMVMLYGRKLAARTINERRGRINALWDWLARRGHTARWPTVPPDPEPIRVPAAWSRDELSVLFQACDLVQGNIAGIPANLWWKALHLVLWDSSERISALLACEWAHLSGEWLVVPAEIRKARARDMAYKLKPPTIAMLTLIREPYRDKIFPWPFNPEYVWTRYKAIRRRAGLAIDRRSAFHRMRKSAATYFEAAGGNATDLLGHASRYTTIKSYLDPRYMRQPLAADLLFRLDDPYQQPPPLGAK